MAKPELYSHAYFQGDEYFSYLEDERVHRINADRKIERLLRHAPPPRVVVEVGCAYGFFLRRVAERFPGVACVGIDVNAEVIDSARSRGGRVQYLVASDPEAFPKLTQDPPVDWLVAWDTFEHLPSAAPWLRYVHDVAARDTLCALTTIDAGASIPRVRKTGWRQFHPPTHLLYPTRKTFRFLAQQQGWSILAQERFGYYRALRQYLAVARSLLPASMRLAYQKFLLNGVFGAGILLDLHDIDLVVFRCTRNASATGGIHR